MKYILPLFVSLSVYAGGSGSLNPMLSGGSNGGGGSATNVTVTLTGAVTGSGPTTSPITTTIAQLPAGVVTNSYSRIFYVATNGDDAAAIINNYAYPFSANFDQTHVLSLATNAGDTVFLLPGTYQATNIVMFPNTLFRGASATSVTIVQTNAIGSDTSFMQPQNGCQISDFTYMTLTNYTWEWQDYASFIGSQFLAPAATNVVLQRLILHGAWDVIYSGGVPYQGVYFTLQNSIVDSRWDIGQSYATPGSVISIGNTYFANSQLQYSPSRLNFSPNFTFNDYGSYFIGFSNVNAFSYCGLSGSHFINGSTNINVILQGYSGMSGFSIDNLGQVCSLNLDKGINYIVSTTTNISMSGIYSLTNMVISITGDAAASGTYSLASVAGDIINSQIYSNTVALWTNKSNNNYKLTLNGNQLTNLLGGYTYPLWTITNNSDVQLYICQNIFNIYYQTDDNSLIAIDGIGTPNPIYFYTNSQTFYTNYIYNLGTSLLGGNIKKDNSGNLILFGNGSGLTNVSAATAVTATTATNVVGGIGITNPVITGATISGNGAGLTNLNLGSLNGLTPTLITSFTNSLSITNSGKVYHVPVF